MVNVSSAYVADYVGVTRSAVSNWLKRNALPEELRPQMIRGAGRDRPEWREDQLPGLMAWQRSHPTPAPRRKVTEVTAAALKPGDVVVSTRGKRPVLITVRRKAGED